MFLKNKSIPETNATTVSDSIREFSRIQAASNITSPMTFSSTVCREQHFRMPLYRYWCGSIKEQPRLHRKQWEFVYICQSLYERGLLKPGRKGLGFGVGKEPLPALFASYGVSILASDLDLDAAKNLGWVHTSQHSNDLSELNTLGLCEEEIFRRAVQFRNIDMNFIPEDLHDFDFCWSSCAFEHLGSISKGLDFVRASINTLRPGGVAIHTTEFNLSSNTETLDNDPSFVIFRRRDLEALATSLEKDGHWVEPIDFCSGNDPIEKLIDLPPYIEEPHLRLQLAGKYVSTSIGLIIRRGLA